MVSGELVFLPGMCYFITTGWMPPENYGKYIMLSRKKIWLYTLGTALAVRGIFAYIVAGSMFRNYHLVRGLDMQTLLRFSEWGSGVRDAVPFFSPHRLLIFLQWFFNGGNHNVWIIFAFQSAIGVLGCAVLADLTLSLTGKRRGALAAGLAAALYLPELVCEFSVLQDSLAVNLTLFAFWSSIRAVRKRFAPVWALGCAVLWSLALAGRPTAVLLFAGVGIWSIYRLQKCRKLRKIIPFAVLLISLLVSFSCFNAVHGWKFSPFYSVMEYAKVYNGSGADSPASEFTVLLNAVKRVPWLFSVYDRPENYNIYFWCEKIPVLHLLPAPGLLWPCGCAGLMILLCCGGWKKERFLLIFLPIVLLALPLCAREVIGRYKLMLTPYFIMAAVAGYYVFKRGSGRDKCMYMFSGGMAAALALASSTGCVRHRAEDLHAWALALENTPGASKEDILAAFGDYWQAAEFRSQKAFQAIIDRALAHRELTLAAGVVAQAYQNGIDRDLVGYYHGWIFVLRGEPAAVEKIYSRIDPAKLPGNLREKYLQICRDTQMLLHKAQK